MSGRCLVIAGMHRSGTSLLSSCIQASGLDLGDDLLGGGVGNEKGHFEDRRFHDAHEKILSSRGIPYGGLLGIANFQIGAQDVDFLRGLVAECQAGRVQWGWKEPRTCLFLSTYTDLIPDLKIVAVYRDYQSVVDSIIRRKINVKLEKIKKKKFLKRCFYNSIFFIYGKNSIVKMADDYLLAWIMYNTSIIAGMKKVGKENAFIIRSSDIASRGSYILDRISSWGFELQPVEFADLYDVQMMQDTVTYKSCNQRLILMADEVLAQLESMRECVV